MTDGNKPCPHCAEPIRLSASLCRHCGRGVERATLAVEWIRDPEAGKVAGVAEMLARASGLSVTLVRLAFLAFGVFNAPLALTCYALLWACTPKRGGVSAADAAMQEAEELVFGRLAGAFQGVTGRPPASERARPEEKYEPDDVRPREAAPSARRPEAGPVAAGPSPDVKPSRYDAEDDEWPRRS